LVDLPLSIKEIIKGIDAVIVTHLHEDHWDKYASKSIPKSIPIFVQNTEDKKKFNLKVFQM
jgi:L-ascorbate metabolism protein UlaG (beta-lactamase superfamily)